jgi:tRNA(Arg) A34 adenosine deaminase TadA
MMENKDAFFIEKSVEVAWNARRKGNHPFGALLVDPEGQVIITGENTVVTEVDCTAHAELNVIRKASKIYDRDFLGDCTLYASTEPCPMCAGAIYWGNVRRVVYGLSQNGLYALIGPLNQEELRLSCKEIFAKGNKAIEVIGPILEDKAKKVHEGFWNT